MGKIIFGFYFLVLYFFLSLAVFAANPPSLSDPADNSTTTDSSPKLSWQYNDTCPSNESCFFIQVDNNSDFSSPEKTTYTNNQYYSPSLDLGQWFWRVKAKDQNGTWSDYSQSRSLTITSPTPQPTSTPTPSTSPTSNFNVSTDSTSINATDSLTVNVQLTNLVDSSQYFLKGAFYQDGSTNYLGLTQVNGNWAKNSDSATTQFSLITDSTGSWSGPIFVMADPNDSGFNGSGSYNFKVARYNSDGSNLTWSNVLTLNINYTPTPAPSKLTSTTPQPTSKPTILPKLASPTNDSIFDSSLVEENRATVAGIATASATEQSLIEQTVTTQKSTPNWWLVAAGLTILLASLFYLLIFTSLINLEFIHQLKKRILTLINLN